MTRWRTLLGLAMLPLLLTTASAQGFDHNPLDRLLRQHVQAGWVDYDAFAAAPTFEEYLAALAGFDPSTLSRSDQLAFWINAYNAYTIKLIVKHKERRSIRNINKALGLFKGKGPWAERLVVVGGQTYDLETVEQGIIRPEFKEPRIHFALVCASVGCPPLRSEAYTGAQLDQQLDDQARQFLTATPGSNRVDASTGTVYLSELFSFNDYLDDFGGSRTTLMRFIARYYPAGPERSLLEAGTAKVVQTEYDWTLNSEEIQRRTRNAPPR
ncbi:MAG: DUF547 domain-containing protein [Gemmatimonadota bacterium]|nr:DUF547 domain-containing protein [Gemmatimonadota bacterium]